MHFASGRLPIKIMSSTSIKGSASAFSLEKTVKIKFKNAVLQCGVESEREILPPLVVVVCIEDDILPLERIGEEGVGQRAECTAICPARGVIVHFNGIILAAHLKESISFEFATLAINQGL